MKFHITKYSLSEGILEKELEYAGDGYAKESGNGGAFRFFGKVGKDCFERRSEAISHAEKMRLAKIASLKKQIAKLEKLTFN
jgi:hypothetical protein